MKKWLLCLGVFASLLAACSASHLASKEKLETSETVARRVENQVDSLDFDAEVTYMYPTRTPGKALDYGWNVRVKGDSIYSYLPYFGRAYQLPYGGGKGLNFSCPIQSSQIQRNKKKGKIRVILSVRNEEDQYRYTFDIYKNGNFDLNIRSNERDQIDFTGKLNLDRK
ncbi:MAG: DUF4251 domain-containing protein [Prevotella sp.]|jgi:hypothetical protein|nr:MULTISPECIES: DUF4251 domain-containing protein [unclassified Prevotella]MCH3984900.1 DUF4251 domain-containing protein [Prevotella sp.]MCH3991464.1 DUF4251 domain-containing protein [Prevotella sp.]MCH4018646.1 DUF4251 domain-containing protein [Prevotella sp.]MCH4100252.1 DUF4251 domain-containing protein [Prevotella sp.]MCH4215455.1 DUF4251 domain-containing protein [Prevotella sp.]